MIIGRSKSNTRQLSKKEDLALEMESLDPEEPRHLGRRRTCSSRVRREHYPRIYRLSASKSRRAVRIGRRDFPAGPVVQRPTIH